MLIWLAGADRALLRQFPPRLRGKYAGIGVAILITGTIAGLSMWFALHTALSLPVAAATVLALGWAVSIMSLDRWLVLSLTRRDDWTGWKGRLNYFAAASPRLLLAVLFGIIIATPITMEIFNSDINYQLSLTHVANLASEEQNPKVQLLKTNVASEQKRVTALLGEEETGGPVQVPAQDQKQINNFTVQRNDALVTEKAAYSALQCQLYGGQIPGSNKPCQPGYGPLGKDAQQEYQTAVSQVSYFNSQIAALNKQVSASLASQRTSGGNQAKEALPVATQQLQADQGELAKLQASFVNANNANTGLFERLSALDAATNDLGRWFARWLIFLFFIVIDCLPVLVKIFHNIAPADRYEQALDSYEQTQLNISNADENSRLQARQQIEAETVDAEAEILRLKLRQRVNAATGGGLAPRRIRRWNWFRPWWANGAAQASGLERTIIQQYDPMGPL
jgi:hypothetical protein